MAYTLVKNQTPATSGDAFMNFTNALLTAGYTMPWYTDGTTATINGSPSVNGLTSAGWVANNYAGCVIRTPDNKEITIQRSNGGNLSRTWRVMYSAVAQFRDGCITFNASAVSGNKFTVSDGTTTKTFVLVTGATGAEVNIPCSVGNSAALQLTAFMTVANTGLALGGTFYDGSATTAGTAYFKKTTRTNYTTVANTSGTPLAAFSPSPTKLPIAYVDQKILCGAGTDNAPTYVDFLPVAGTYRQNVSVNGSSPYHHGMVLSTAATGVITQHWFFDRMSGAPTGEYDDVVFSLTAWLPCSVGSLSREGSNSLSWVGPSSTAGWGCVCALFLGYRIANADTLVIPTACAVDPFTGQDTPDSLWWARRPAGLYGNPGPYGIHGRSTLLKWNSATRAIGNLLSVTSTGDHFCADSVSMVGWDNTVVTV